MGEKGIAAKQPKVSLILKGAFQEFPPFLKGVRGFYYICIKLTETTMSTNHHNILK